MILKMAWETGLSFFVDRKRYFDIYPMGVYNYGVNYIGEIKNGRENLQLQTKNQRTK